MRILFNFAMPNGYFPIDGNFEIFKTFFEF